MERGGGGERARRVVLFTSARRRWAEAQTKMARRQGPERCVGGRARVAMAVNVVLGKTTMMLGMRDGGGDGGLAVLGRVWGWTRLGGEARLLSHSPPGNGARSSQEQSGGTTMELHWIFIDAFVLTTAIPV